MGYVLNAFRPETTWAEAKAILDRIDFESFSRWQEEFIATHDID